MKAVLVAVLCACVLGANLRSKQTTSTATPNIPGLDTINQLNQQFLDILTNMTAGFLLQQLYPDNWQTVLGEVDTCVDSALTASMNETQSALTDAFNLMNACSAPDPSQAVNQLIQDTLNALTALLSPQCTFSVDLMGDLTTFLATAIGQGVNMVGPFSQFLMMGMGPMTGIMNQMTNQMMMGFQPYINTMGTVLQNLVETLGVSQDDINTLNTAINTTMTDLNAAGADLSSNGNVTAADIQTVINDVGAIAGDVGADLNEVLTNLEGFIAQGLGEICSLYGSFSSLIPNLSSMMMPGMSGSAAGAASAGAAPAAGETPAQ